MTARLTILVLLCGVSALFTPLDSRAEEVALPAPATDGWKAITFPRIERHTSYVRTEIDGRNAVRAESNCSASALVLEIPDVDLRRVPRLEWEWKIVDGLEIENERIKAGDDFAARVYVLFRFDPSRASLWERARHDLGRLLFGEGLPGSAVNYVWSSRPDSVGERWPNPFASSNGMIALGGGPPNGWVEESVDVRADYLALFGHDPPALLGLGLMTDSDNSCQKALAYFAGFRFVSRPSARVRSGRGG